MFPRNYILFFASNLQMRNQISFEDFLSKVFAWLWMTCFQIARPEWVTVWASYLSEFVWVMTSRGGSAAASLSLAMIITAAAWSLIIVFIHLLFHGSKITIYFDEEDEVRKNSSQYMNENVFSVIENWKLAFQWLSDQCYWDTQILIAAFTSLDMFPH